VPDCQEYCQAEFPNATFVIGTCGYASRICECEVPIPRLCDCPPEAEEAFLCTLENCTLLCPDGGFCDPTNHTCVCFPCPDPTPSCVPCAPDDLTCVQLNCSLVCPVGTLPICDYFTGACQCEAIPPSCLCPDTGNDPFCPFLNCTDKCAAQNATALNCTGDGLVCFCETPCEPLVCDGTFCGSELPDLCGNVISCPCDSEGDVCLGGQCVPAPPVCGNGVIEGLEECDDGVANGKFDSLCSSTCLNAFCGDGMWTPSLGEECDSGGVNTSLCTRDCKLADTTPCTNETSPSPSPSGSDSVSTTPAPRAIAGGTCSYDTTTGDLTTARAIRWICTMIVGVNLVNGVLASTLR